MTMRRTLILSCFTAVAAAAASPDGFARDGTRTECVGDFTIQLTGDIDYALVPAPALASIDSTGMPQVRFPDGLWAQGSRIDIDAPGFGLIKLFESGTASSGDLAAVGEALNTALTQRKQSFLDDAQWLDAHPDAAKDIDPERRERASLRSKADKVGQFLRAKGDPVTLIGPAESTPEVLSLIDGHLFAAKASTDASPARLGAALGNLVKPRGTFEVPVAPGLCVPHAVVGDGREPAEVAVNFELKDHPGIFVLLEQSDATDSQLSAKDFIVSAIQPGRNFVGSVETKPLDRIRPTHAFRVDGREGLGAFAQVRREGALANNADRDLDWAFIGYVPGQAGLQSGQSYNITLKVERFGRFARQPMTESEFRTLVRDLSESIRHRDNAALPR